MRPPLYLEFVPTCSPIAGDVAEFVHLQGEAKFSNGSIFCCFSEKSAPMPSKWGLYSCKALGEVAILFIPPRFKYQRAILVWADDSEGMQFLTEYVSKCTTSH